MVLLVLVYLLFCESCKDQCRSDSCVIAASAEPGGGETGRGPSVSQPATYVGVFQSATVEIYPWQIKGRSQQEQTQPKGQQRAPKGTAKGAGVGGKGKGSPNAGGVLVGPKTPGPSHTINHRRAIRARELAPVRPQSIYS